MKASLQQQIAPGQVKNSMDFSTAPIKSADDIADPGAEPKVEFRTLLGNSNQEMARERAAKKSGDFSAAKTDDEFFKMLSDRANPTQTPKNKLDKDDFLKLFVAQMQHQNPLSPDDSSQMASQLAQFNSLEQMLNVNKTLEAMKAGQETTRAVGMLDYIGKEVSVEGGKLRLNAGKITDTSFNVERDVSDATLEVRDGSGVLVASKSLGGLKPGDHKLEWDGKANEGKRISDGVYSFAVVAKGIDGSNVPIDLKSRVKITGVDLKDAGGSFFTETGKVKIGDVSSVGVAGFADLPKAAKSVLAVPSSDATGQKAGDGDRETGSPAAPNEVTGTAPVADEQGLNAGEKNVSDQPPQDSTKKPPEVAQEITGATAADISPTRVAASQVDLNPAAQPKVAVEKAQ